MIRRFENDYAGAWKGYCLTRESAINAAMKHIVSDGYSRATITDRQTAEVVARVRVNEKRTQAIVEVIKPFKKIGL